MRRGRMSSAVPDGWAAVGIGAPGTTPIHSFRQADSCIAHSAGASIHRDWSIDLRIAIMAAFTIAFTAAIGDADFIGATDFEDQAFIEAADFMVAAVFGEAASAEAADFTAAAGAKV
jgi:hypothetical protein